MFEQIDIHKQLLKEKQKTYKQGNYLLTEANRILNEDLFSEKKILNNLQAYNRSHELLDEQFLNKVNLFSLHEIKQICITYRLKCLDSRFYKAEIPYEAVLKIKNLNDNFQKELKQFKVLGSGEAFSEKGDGALYLFSKTNNGNYYLIHTWGKAFNWTRKLKYWPLQYFENLFVSIAFFTLILTLSLPTGFISLDETVGYWSGFRIAAFFHLLIFNMGVTAYIGFAFSKNFSSSVWNQSSDF